MLDGLKNMVQNVFGGSGNGGKHVYEQDLVDYVEKEFKRRQDERRAFELQWRLNLAFYEGNQYLDINTASMSLEEQPILYDWQEREAFNHIASNIETRISKLKRVRSILKVRPGTTEREDVHSAKVGSQVLKTNYHDQNIRDKQSQEYIWSEICGTVFRKHIWNKDIGRVIGIVQTPDESGNTTQEEVREGDGETIVVPPQEIYPDSSYRNGTEACKSIIHAVAFDLDDINEIFGVEVGPERAEVEKLQRTMNGLGGLGYGQGGFMVHTVKLEHHAIVKEYWELPTKTYPDGRLIIVAGGKLLYAGKNPYLVGDDQKPGFPFAMLRCLERPGIFWGKTVLERLIPVQRRYNALKNRKAEYLNRAAIGQYDVMEESVDLDAFELEAGMPGAITTYARNTTPPRMRETPPLPSTFAEEEQRLLNEFAILSGVSEITRDSSVPSGVKSGVAISLLQEQDDTRISNTVENIERFNIQSGKIQLRLAKQFVKAPRTMHIVGKNNVAEVIDWQGSDLRSEDVYLENSSALAESISRKRQMVFDILGAGLLVDPDTGRIDKEMRSRVLEMIELGEWEEADSDEQLHIAKAERENRAMQRGQFAQVVAYDDHILHIAKHNKFRLSVDYEELKASNPMIDQIFDMHINMHLIPMQQRAMSIMQQQAAQQASGGGESAA